MEILFTDNMLKRIKRIKNKYENIKEFIVRAVINYVCQIEREREDDN